MSGSLAIKPRTLPRIKIQRLPKGKHMTIAAGFPCKDGLVLCADTQEVIAGYVKTDTEKVTIIQDPRYNLVITGAGDGDLIDMAAQEIYEAVQTIKPPETLQSTIKRITTRMFNEQIKPYAEFPYQDRPTMELLIGIQSQGVATLYKARGTIFRRLDKPDCVGMGLALGKSLTEKFFSSDLSLPQAGIVALYILHQAKRWVDGCDGNSDIILLTKDMTWSRIPTDEVQGLEDHFTRFDNYLKPILIGCADAATTHQAFDALMKDFQLNMFTLRGRFMSMREFFTKLSELTGHKFDLSGLDETKLLASQT